MPSYEYKCPDGHTYVEVRSINAEASRDTCPECDKPITRVFSAPPITFKGGGFHANHG
jgi:putative FmdB family regulatory protein